MLLTEDIHEGTAYIIELFRALNLILPNFALTCRHFTNNKYNHFSLRLKTLCRLMDIVHTNTDMVLLHSLYVNILRLLKLVFRELKL